MKERDISTIGPVPTGFDMIKKLAEQPTCSIEDAAEAVGIGR